MKKAASALVLTFFIVSGCMHVSLLPGARPLQEKVLEGEGKAKILLLDLDGMISFKGEPARLGVVKKPSKVAFFREALRKAEKDPEIQGVIVRINSGGGTVGASDTLFHEIMTFRKKKEIPIYAYIMELGTSGGYYAACAADRIIASPTAITGSIGVLVMRFNLEGLFSKIGVSGEAFKSGPQKDFWSPFRPSTEAEKRMLQDMIDRLYGRFLEVIYANRGKVLSEQEIRALADGRVLTGTEALQAKLVDEVAYLDEAIDGMKKTLKAAKVKVVAYAPAGEYKSNIYSEFPEMPANTPQVNLISINAEELSLLPGVRFMYLWNP